MMHGPTNIRVTKYVDCINRSDHALTDRDWCSNLIRYIKRATDKYHEILKHFKILMGSK